MDERYYTLAEGQSANLLSVFVFCNFLADYLNNKGCPYASNTTSVQLRNEGGGGLVLLQDTQLIETLAHFSRKRIPER